MTHSSAATALLPRLVTGRLNELNICGTYTDIAIRNWGLSHHNVVQLASHLSSLLRQCSKPLVLWGSFIPKESWETSRPKRTPSPCLCLWATEFVRYVHKKKSLFWPHDQKYFALRKGFVVTLLRYSNEVIYIFIVIKNTPSCEHRMKPPIHEMQRTLLPAEWLLASQVGVCSTALTRTF
jgi:hypothetical protein